MLGDFDLENDWLFDPGKAKELLDWALGVYTVTE